MSERTIKGCPFCGSKNLFTTRDKDGEEKWDMKLDNWQITCGDCHSRGPTSASIEGIRQAWDTRKPES